MEQKHQPLFCLRGVVPPCIAQPPHRLYLVGAQAVRLLLAARAEAAEEAAAQLVFLRTLQNLSWPQDSIP